MSLVDDPGRLAAEQHARVLVDRQLEAAGWVVQDKKDLNLFAGTGIAVREVVLKPGHGRVDYLLYVEKAVVGVIEAPSPRARRCREWNGSRRCTPKGFRRTCA